MSRTNSARRSRGYIDPCLPSPAKDAPVGPDWLHEIKHDGFRMLVRRGPDRVRLFTRGGHDWSGRFPGVAVAAKLLRATSFTIDGELVACDDDGVPAFDMLRYGRDDAAAFLYYLIEHDGEDLRALPIETRKARLARLIKPARGSGIALVEYIDADGPTVFRAACRMGLEGIISKRKGSRYTSGRSEHWRKVKNPASAAVKREAEEDWGGRRKRGRAL